MAVGAEVGSRQQQSAGRADFPFSICHLSVSICHSNSEVFSKCEMRNDKWKMENLLSLPTAAADCCSACRLLPCPADCSCRLPTGSRRLRFVRKDLFSNACQQPSTRCLRRRLRYISGVRPVGSREDMHVPKHPSPAPDQSLRYFPFRGA